MQRLLLATAVALAMGAAAAAAQEVDLRGQWQVYRMETLSIYTLLEHQGSGGSQQTASNSLQLNNDGSLSTDLVGLGVQSWQQDQGFLVMSTETGNLFYRPRVLGNNTVLLVQTDVLARNGVIINITSRPAGNLLLIRA